MKQVLRLSDYGCMSPAQQRDAVTRLAQAARSAPAADLTATTERIAAYERKYNLTSDAMVAAIDNGSISESNDVCDWLILLKLRAHVAARRFACAPL